MPGRDSFGTIGGLFHVKPGDRVGGGVVMATVLDVAVYRVLKPGALGEQWGLGHRTLVGTHPAPRPGLGMGLREGRTNGHRFAARSVRRAATASRMQWSSHPFGVMLPCAPGGHRLPESRTHVEVRASSVATHHPGRGPELCRPGLCRPRSGGGCCRSAARNRLRWVRLRVGCPRPWRRT